MFKVGDRVKSLSSGAEYTVHSVGLTGSVKLQEWYVDAFYPACGFERVAETPVKSKADLKPGDTVRVYTEGLVSSTAKAHAGKLLTVKSNFDCYMLCNEEVACMGIYHREFEVVPPSETKPAESELERLVRVANEGLDALEALFQKHNDGSVLTGSGRTPGSLPTWLTAERFKIKPKAPAFETFYVGVPHWGVKLEGDVLQIGRQKFSAKEFLTGVKSCQDLNTGDKMPQLGQHQLWGGRKHLTWNGHKLVWDDVDRILAALEKAGIK